MPVKRITVDRFSDLLRGLPREVEAATVRGLRSAGMRAVSEVVSEIDRAQPYPAVNTGGMRQSVRAYPLVDGSLVSVEAPHARFMEHGTRPHFPPLGPLFVWAIRKGLAHDEDEAASIAWAVARKIERFGIAPRHFFRKAMQRVRSKVVPAEVNRELELLAASGGAT